MKVKVYAPAYCIDEPIDDSGYMTVEEGTTVMQVLKQLKTPIYIRALVIVAVNHQRVKKNHILKNGDTISILGAVSGG